MLRGTVIAQVIGFLASIYLAKIYGEAAYGYFGFFISLINIISIISTLQLEHCIITSKSNESSRFWFSAILILIPITTLLSFIVLELINQFYPFEEFNKTIIISTFIGVLLLSLNVNHESYYTFKKQFSIIANNKVVLTILNVGFQWILFYKYNVFGLIFGFLTSQLLLFLFNTYKNIGTFTSFQFSMLKSEVRTHSEILNYLFPSNLLNALALNFMPLLILAFFSAKEAGTYFFSLKILGAPLFLISSSVSKVYFKKSVELLEDKKRELYQLTKKVVGTNVLIMLGFLIMINTIGVYALEWFLGNNWNDLRTYLWIVSFLILGRSFFTPISSLIVSMNKNLIGLIFNIFLLLLNIAAIYYGIISNDLKTAIFILSIVGGIGYVALLLYFMTALKKN